jgi:hypothetical protein
MKLEENKEDIQKNSKKIGIIEEGGKGKRGTEYVGRSILDASAQNDENNFFISKFCGVDY